MEIFFDEGSHTYTNSKGEVYTSVTTFISKFKKPFDSQKHAERVAKRENVDPSFVLSIWKELAEKSQIKGTGYHKIMENFIKKKEVPAEYLELAESFLSKVSFYLKSNSVVSSEKLLFNHDYKIAGTADIIIENDNNFYVLDFKTNKKFNYTNQYNDYFFEPIDFLPQCEFTTYTLQLSIYAYLNELLSKKKCAGIKVFYLKENDKRYWQEINTIYMKDTIIKMLETQKK